VSIKEPKKASDQSLIQAAKKGDQKAFAALIRRYEETVYKFSFKVCRDREKAEETLQDTFVNVFRKLNTFDGRSKFSTWLYTIVSNNCLMKRRRRKLHALEESLEVFDDPPDSRNRQQPAGWEKTPAEVLLDKELQTLLNQAIVKLPVEYRLVFVLRDVEGRSTQETASILNISEEATKSRLRRARAFLRDQLDPYMADHGAIR
jgi:RNA polymerase sigma-70 factor (ECF subfamily)